MESIITIIALVILSMTLAFADEIRELLGRIKNKNVESSNKSENKSEQVKQYEAANPNIPPHILHHVAGQRNAWNLTKIALYKMYLDGDLLNCESIILTIEKKMQEFTDQEIVDDLTKQFENYMRQVLHPPTPAAEIGTGDQNPPIIPPEANGEK